MNKILLICVLAAVVGCSSMDAIYKNYDTLVNVNDGVNEEEAKIIAQKKLVSTQEKRDYRVTAPDIKTTAQALKYPDFWFVIFGHNWFSPISTDPLAKTYTELRNIEFLVVINKKTGEVVFVGQWYPRRADNFDWVFQPNEYKKDDPLALPPGEPSKILF